MFKFYFPRSTYRPVAETMTLFVAYIFITEILFIN